MRMKSDIGGPTLTLLTSDFGSRKSHITSGLHEVQMELSESLKNGSHTSNCYTTQNVQFTEFFLHFRTLFRVMYIYNIVLNRVDQMNI
jgi:hypothetical protein